MKLGRSKIVLLSVVLAMVLAACDFGTMTVGCDSLFFRLYFDEGTLVGEVDDIGDLPGLIDNREPLLEIYDGNGNSLFSETEGTFDLDITVIGEESVEILLTYGYPVASQADPITARIYSEADETYPETTWLVATGNCNEPEVEDGPRPVRTFMDGRINYRDAAAPFAAYGVGDNLHIYWVTGPNTGKLELIATAEELAAVPEFPETNMLVKANEALGIYLYRLTDGKWQVQARMFNGKLYVLIFEDMFNRDYVSIEVEN